MNQHHQPGNGMPHQPVWGPPPPPKRNSAGKIVGFGCLGAVGLFVALAVIGALAGGGDSGSTSVSGSGEAASPTALSSAPAAAPEVAKTAEADTAATDPAKSDTATTASLPDLRGKGLQSAQDQAQAAGFFHLTSHDALGRGRMQAFDRNWKVCSQTPSAGARATDTEVDFGAVKLEEDCPAKDAGAVREAGATMPDFGGKSVKVARQALDSGTSITVEDASGDDRMVLVESNWKVCTQSPAAGAKLDGQPVAFTAVKFDESC